MKHINRYADRLEFERLYAEFRAATPHCPHNRYAAEALATPEERRGWVSVYITWRKTWIDENSNCCTDCNQPLNDKCGIGSNQPRTAIS